VIASLVVLALVAGDVALRIDPQIATWVELDTNAKRVPTGALDDDGTLDPGKQQNAVVGDGLTRAEGSISAEARRESFTLKSDSAAGLKLFFTQASERMGVIQSRASLFGSDLPFGFFTQMSALGKARGQLSGARTYGVARGDATLGHALPFGFAARGGVMGETFHAFDNPLFSFTAGALVAGASWVPTNAERFDLNVEVGARGYPFSSREPGNNDVSERRRDGVLLSSLSFTSARSVFLAAGYTLLRNSSNARAESYTRHRLSAIVGFRLPEQITCSAQGALQLTQYDDGVSLGQRYFLGDDEESQNVLDVQISRPLLGGLYIEARASFMGNELAVEGARFSRQTAGIGLRAEL
jgi:hypothetical protein